MTTIAIVERYPLLRVGLANIIEQHFKDTMLLVCGGIDELAVQAPNESLHLVVLGLNGGGQELGLTILAELISQFPVAKVIVYDDQRDPVGAFKYLRKGAYGYIPKSEGEAAIIEGITQVLKDKRYVAREILDAIFEEQIFGWEKRLRTRRMLSQKEYEVADQLVKGRGVSHIAAVLNKKVSTVSTLKRRLFRKLGVNSIEELSKKLGSLT